MERLINLRKAWGDRDINMGEFSEGCRLAIGESCFNEIRAIIQEIESLQSELAALKESMRWIPVEERLPEEEQEVLAVTSFNSQCTMIYSRDIEENTVDFIRAVTCRRCDGMGLGSITHWMPMPTLPKERNET